MSGSDPWSDPETRNLWCRAVLVCLDVQGHMTLRSATEITAEVMRRVRGQQVDLSALGHSVLIGQAYFIGAPVPLTVSTSALNHFIGFGSPTPAIN